MNLLDKILSRMGYMKKSEVEKNYVHNKHQFLVFENILSSFNACQITNVGEKTSSIKLIWPDAKNKTRLNYKHLFTSNQHIDSIKSKFHQYIYDRGIKAIIEQHEKEGVL